MAIKSGNSAYDSIHTSFDDLAKPFHTSHPSLGKDAFFSTEEAGGGARTYNHGIPSFKAGSESPTLGHDAHPIKPYHDSMREEGYKPVGSYRGKDNTRINEYRNSKGHEAVIHSKEGAITRTGVAHADENHPTYYKAKEHKSSEGFKANLKSLNEDSTGPTGKRFTERLHERSGDGKFEPSGRPTKQVRRKE